MAEIKKRLSQAQRTLLDRRAADVLKQVEKKRIPIPTKVATEEPAGWKPRQSPAKLPTASTDGFRAELKPAEKPAIKESGTKLEAPQPPGPDATKAEILKYQVDVARHNLLMRSAEKAREAAKLAEPPVRNKG